MDISVTGVQLTSVQTAHWEITYLPTNEEKNIVICLEIFD